MPRVLVVLPSQTYRAGEFITAGDELGVDLIVASDVDPPIDMADRYLKIDCENPETAAEAIVARGDAIPIDGIVAADDAGVVVAALAGTALGLVANDPMAARATRDKAAQRAMMSAAEVPQPTWALIEPGSDAHQATSGLTFPMVLKPLDRAAGQGVVFVGSEADLAHQVARVRSIFTDGESRTLLAEEFLEGNEVAVEGILTPAGLITLAIFDKPAPISGEGFQETILVTPSRHPNEIQQECVRVATAAVAAIGLTHGPVHIELMVGADSVRVIEVAARSIGGLCSRSLRFGLMDTSLESLILRNALGRDKRELRRRSGASGVLMIPIPRPGILIAIDGLDDVRSMEGISGFDLTAHPGETVMPPPDGDRYIGFVFSEAGTPELVEMALRRAMDRIEVTVE